MSSQRLTATSLFRSGLSLQLVGLVWGGVVQLTPFPRLARAAHLHLMIEGAMVLLVGLVLMQTSVIRIGAVGCRTVYWAVAGIWITIAAEIANAFWGTKLCLPLAAMEAGAQGAVAWQEILMLVTHIVPGIGLILAFIVLVNGTFAEEEKKTE